MPSINDVELGVLVSTPHLFQWDSDYGQRQCFLQQFSELLGSNVAIQPDDRGREWSSGACNLTLRVEASASVR